MIRHLLKLVWHRKRANALVMAEIFVSFLIVFAVVTLSTVMLTRWSAPLGYDWRNVWMIEIDQALPQEHSETNTAGPTVDEVDHSHDVAAAAGHVVRELETYPEVVAAATDAMTPYSNNQWQSMVTVKGRNVFVGADQASDRFAEVLRMPIVKGRWFSREDNGLKDVPLVIDAHAARAMFGDEDPIGQRFSAGDFETDKNASFRVVGVVAPYRGDGDLSETQGNMIFLRSVLWTPEELKSHAGKWTDGPGANRIVFRVRPGTPRSFEAELDQRLRKTVGATFHIQRMEDMRDASLKMRLSPVIVLTLVSLFLIAMVALGLTGVLWQTVTRRMREIGLRRALGASGSAVRRQVLGEVTLLATLSMIVGSIIVLQLPIIGAFRIVTPSEFTGGFVAALAVIYGITLLCGAYPSWLASTIEPADALRYE